MNSYRNKKGMAILLLLLYTILLISTAGCNPLSRPTYAEPAESVDERLVAANTAFAFNLLQVLRNETPNENLFISPASISLALAMTYNGAAGDTAAAMAEVLQWNGMSQEEINGAFADLYTILQNPDPKVELAIANSLWARKGVEFYESFLQKNRDYYQAEVATLDFDSPDAATTINRWVEKQTKGRIKDMVEPPIDPLTVLYLINAIYFKAEWSVPFNPRQTMDLPFNLPDGSSKEHPFMLRSGQFQHLTGDGFRAVAIPYGKTKRLSMYIFLPDEELNLEIFYNQLTPENWNLWLQSFRETEGSVGLPRFAFEYEASLNKALKSLGMGVAFDEDLADFSTMRSVSPTIYIGNVKHKTFIEVNEKGTEAAAATKVEMKTKSTAPLESFSMVMNRPFSFSIVDNKTNSILFIGSVNNPE